MRPSPTASTSSDPGPTDLGREIDWRSDFKTGRRWPLRHGSLLRLAYGDGSDVKVPWELSRGQHLPLLAAAHRLTGDRRYLDELGAQLESWIADNPPELGPNWASTMDTAIRAANWVAALAIAAEHVAGEAWFERALASLLLHGRFVRTHLEWSEARGNHYLADVVGLLPVAALFSGGREGREWAEWAAGELVSELEHQVRKDGTAHEASTGYHRLVTELFVCGTQAADAARSRPPARLVPRAAPAHARLRSRLHAAGRARPADRRRRRRSLPPARRLRRRPARPPPPLRAVRARDGERRVPGRGLLRPPLGRRTT